MLSVLKWKTDIAKEIFKIKIKHRPKSKSQKSFPSLIRGHSPEITE